MAELRGARFRHLAEIAAKLRAEAERIEEAAATYLRYEGKGQVEPERETARGEALFAISRANRYVGELIRERRVIEGRPVERPPKRR